MSHVIPFPQQAVPVSNRAVLEAVFGAGQWARAHVVAVAGEPARAPRTAWAGGAAVDDLHRFPADANTYYTVSLFRGGRRREGDFVSMHVVVLDDVGPKVPVAVAEGLLGAPSYRLETSPGNEQWGYILDPPERDVARVKAFQKDLIVALLGEGAVDPGQRDVTRLARLPVGRNRKPAHGATGYACRMTAWEPGRKFAFDEIERLVRECLGVKINQAASQAANQATTSGTSSGVVPDKDTDTGLSPASAAAPGGGDGGGSSMSSSMSSSPLIGPPLSADEIEDLDVVLDVMRGLGMVLGQARDTGMGRGYDVRCPWLDEHTDRAESGAVYVAGHIGGGRFKCHHGHCATRTPRELWHRMDELLCEDSGGLDSMARREFTEVDPASVPVPVWGTGTGTGIVDLIDIDPSENGIALALVERDTRAGAGGPTMRYDQDTQTWHAWTDARWVPQPASADAIVQRARTLSRQVLANAASQKGLKALSTYRFAEQVTKFARIDPRVRVPNTYWNPDPMTLGVPGGYIDLSSADKATRSADPGQRITRQTRVAPAPPGSACPPRWRRFLDEVTGGDADYVLYLQMLCGYLLTGEVRESRVFFAHGSGSNGKSVLLGTIAHVMGEYAKTATAGLFMDSPHAQHPTGIAQLLNGPRLIRVPEMKAGQAWNIALVKDLTGNEGPISARFMGKDFFEGRMHGKLVFSGNHVPTLASVDEATRRRIAILPFAQTFTDRTKIIKDKTLDQVLRGEAAGILRWMIDGVEPWTLFGLDDQSLPAVVREATSEYFEEQNPVATWMADRCDVAPGRWVYAAEAFEDYKNWCLDANMPHPVSQRGFATQCEAVSGPRGALTAGRRMNGQTVEGMTLRGAENHKPF